MAIDQFTAASESMIGMHKEKLDALYHLGTTYEATGNLEKANDSFKQIYQANVNFRDVAQKMAYCFRSMGLFQQVGHDRAGKHYRFSPGS